MTDTTPATEACPGPGPLGAGSAVLRFSHGGSLSHFQPGERLVIGNPAGSMNPVLSPVEGNDVYFQLLDTAGTHPPTDHHPAARHHLCRCRHRALQRARQPV